MKTCHYCEKTMEKDHIEWNRGDKVYHGHCIDHIESLERWEDNLSNKDIYTMNNPQLFEI